MGRGFKTALSYASTIAQAKIRLSPESSSRTYIIPAGEASAEIGLTLHLQGFGTGGISDVYLICIWNKCTVIRGTLLEG